MDGSTTQGASHAQSIITGGTTVTVQGIPRNHNPHSGTAGELQGPEHDRTGHIPAHSTDTEIRFFFIRVPTVQSIPREFPREYPPTGFSLRRGIPEESHAHSSDRDRTAAVPQRCRARGQGTLNRGIPFTSWCTTHNLQCYSQNAHASWVFNRKVTTRARRSGTQWQTSSCASSAFYDGWNSCRTH